MLKRGSYGRLLLLGRPAVENAVAFILVFIFLVDGEGFGDLAEDVVAAAIPFFVLFVVRAASMPVHAIRLVHLASDLLFIDALHLRGHPHGCLVHRAGIDEDRLGAWVDHLIGQGLPLLGGHQVLVVCLVRLGGHGRWAQILHVVREHFPDAVKFGNQTRLLSR